VIKHAKSLACAILFALTVAALFSCGSRKLPLDFSPAAGSNDPYVYLGFDPLAPARETPHHPLDEIASYDGIEAGGYKLVAVDSDLQPAGIPEGVRVQVDGSSVSIIAGNGLYSDCYLYLFYPAAEQHPVAMDKGSALDERDVFVAVDAGPGAIAFGTARIRSEARSLRTGEIASFEFASGPAPLARSVCTAATNDNNKVENLVTSVNVDATVTLSWTEIHPGDYDNNGVVVIADITPVALMFNQNMEGPNPGRVDLVDGDRSGEVNIADITPLAINFGTGITGYVVYRTLLANADEVPLITDTGRWTQVEQAGGGLPSAVRDFTGQDFRLPYTFLDSTPEPGYYGYYVRPYSQDTDTPNVGPASNVARTSQPTGMAELILEVMNGPFFVLDGDVILRVWVDSGYNMFSVNARFEYNNSVLEFVDAVPFLDGYDANVLFDEANGGDPLFLGARIGASATDPDNYDLAAFNATKRYPALTVIGSGPAAYFTFRVIGGSGPVADAFRFPQSSTNIWIWGPQYNVPLPGPRLGTPVSINVAE